ncbi:MAG: hypothetical protein M1358_08770 [Chloroflexi bacterium]|nr:hypothetical protein [Chloroflexota bacterium]
MDACHHCGSTAVRVIGRCGECHKDVCKACGARMNIGGGAFFEYHTECWEKGFLARHPEAAEYPQPYQLRETG